MRIHILLALLISIISQTNIYATQTLPSVVIFGDSNTWLGGDDCSKKRGWNAWFASAFANSACRSYARSGATWSHTPLTKVNLEENVGCISDCNVTTNQILRLQDDIEKGITSKPDIIVIALGTNDAWYPEHRPNAIATDSTDVTTVVGAAISDLRLLQSLLPAAKIVLLTPLRSSKISDDRTSAVAEMIRQAAKATGCEVIDLQNLSPIQASNSAAMKLYTTDGVHTSEAGAKAVGEIVARELTNLASN